MDALFSVAAVFALSIPMGAAFALFVARGPELLAGFFGPRRPDGWPRGVEEEDPSFVETFRLGPTAAVPQGDADEEPEAAPTERVSRSGRCVGRAGPNGWGRPDRSRRR